jgi:hypothetical protein
MRKTARFTFSALLLCAFAGALVMLTLCARVWASDTFVWTDPTGVTPGQVNVTVIVGNSTYYYIVNNVSFPTVQELVLSLQEEGGVPLHIRVVGTVQLTQFSLIQSVGIPIPQLPHIRRLNQTHVLFGVMGNVLLGLNASQ